MPGTPLFLQTLWVGRDTPRPIFTGTVLLFAIRIVLFVYFFDRSPRNIFYDDSLRGESPCEIYIAAFTAGFCTG